jgi:nucleoside-diphosphate-sugar epimerase
MGGFCPLFRNCGRDNVKCLVSGATGFIGRDLCRQLAGRGDLVTALGRRGGCLPDGTPVHAVDLASADPDPALLQRVDVVFHLAGIAHRRAGAAAYHEVNYLATLRLARLAAAAGARCFIFLSSVKAMGAPPGAGARGEEECLLPGDPYGLSKWRAECALREEFAGSPMAVVILRPALVCGPGARGNLRLLARAGRWGLPRPPALGGRSMIALPDLVELLCEIADHPPAGVQTWIACDGRAYSSRDLYDLLREAGGRGRGAAWLPRWGWRLAASLLDRLRPRPGESTWDRLFGYELYSNRALLAATGWRPRSTPREMVGALVLHAEKAPR